MQYITFPIVHIMLITLFLLLLSIVVRKRKDVILKRNITPFHFYEENFEIKLAVKNLLVFYIGCRTAPRLNKGWNINGVGHIRNIFR